MRDVLLCCIMHIINMKRMLNCKVSWTVLPCVSILLWFDLFLWHERNIIFIFLLHYNLLTKINKGTFRPKVYANDTETNVCN